MFYGSQRLLAKFDGITNSAEPRTFNLNFGLRVQYLLQGKGKAANTALQLRHRCWIAIVAYTFL